MLPGSSREPHEAWGFTSSTNIRLLVYCERMNDVNGWILLQHRNKSTRDGIPACAATCASYDGVGTITPILNEVYTKSHYKVERFEFVATWEKVQRICDHRLISDNDRAQPCRVRNARTPTRKEIRFNAQTIEENGTPVQAGRRT